MSVIDSRIVEMKFDNKEFESGASKTLDTLQKLKAATDFSGNKGLKGISEAANNINLSGLERAVYSIQDRFSTMGIVGMTALTRLTNFAIDTGKNIANGLIGPIKSGGFNRAMNLENAKFQLEGLKVAWQDILPDIEHGVNETAYGLDAAAKVAAQLSASGVQTGDEMKNALRGISGVAAMTNSSYEEIGHIFTTVAGNGRMFATELNRIGARGLNASAALADFFNKVNEGSDDIAHVPQEVQDMVKSISRGMKVGEQEIRDFVSKGKINFEIFSNAMDSAFGDQAKKANETFTGALSNMKSALGRIGAKFATPYLNNMRDIFNALRVLFNGVNKMIDPIVATYEKVFSGITKYIVDLVGSTQSLATIQNVITGIRNVFWALMSVLMPVKAAFQSIFPPKTRDDVLAAAYSFKEFTERLILSESAADGIKTVFKGLFSIIKTIGDIFKGLLTALSPVGNMFLSIGKSLFRLLTELSKVVSMRRMIAEVNGTITNTFQKIASVLTPVCNFIASAIDKLIDSLIKFIQYANVKIPPFKGFGDLGISFEKPAAIIGKASEIVKKAIGGIIEIFKGSVPIFQTIGRAIGGAIGGIADGFSNAFNANGINGVLGVLTGSLLTGTALNFTGFIKTLTDGFKSLIGMPEKIGGIFGSLNDALTNMSKANSAGAVKDIAKSIAILAGSLLLLSSIDPVRLTVSLGAVAALMKELEIVAVSLGGLSTGGFFDSIKNFISMGSVSLSLKSLAVSIGILAVSMKLLSTIDTAEVISGLLSIGIMLQMLVKYTKAMSGIDKSMGASAKGLMSLSIGILILSKAVKTLGQLDLASLAKGLGSMIVILYSLAKFLNGLESDLRVSTGTSILLIATSMLIFGSAMAKIGSLPLTEIVKGLGGIAGALLAVGVFMNKLETAGAFTKSASILILSAAISVLSKSLIAISQLSWGQLAVGLAGIAGGLILMGGAMTIIGAKGLGGAAAMLVMATAIRVFTPAIISLSKIKFTNILKALVAIAGAFVVLGGAAALLTPIILPMIGLAGAITLLGAGMLAAGAGMTLFAAGLAALAAGGAASIGAIVTALNTIIGMIPLFLTTLGSGVLGFLNTITAGVPELVTNICAAIITCTPQLVEAGWTIINSLLSGIAQNIQGVVEYGIQIITGFLNGIATQMPLIVQSGIDLTVSFFNSMADGIRGNHEIVTSALMNFIGALVESLFSMGLSFLEVGTSFMTNLLNGIVTFMENIYQALLHMGAEMLIKIGVPEDWVKVGSDLIGGLISGIANKARELISMVADLAGRVLEKIRSVWDSHSDSREGIAIGKDLDGGLATGIEENSDMVVNAAADVSAKALAEFEEGAAGISKVASEFANKYSKASKGSRSDLAELRKEVHLQKKAAKESKTENDNLSKSLDSVGESGEKAAAGIGKAGSAAKKSKEDSKELSETLYDKVKGAIDVFGEFSMKTEMSKEKILKNMQSQLDGVASWSAKLSSLAERGVSDGLLKYLAEMGPQGYEYVHAFTTMTTEELARANEMYASQMAIPAAATVQITDSFRKTGMDVGEGFLKGLKEKWPLLKDAGVQSGEAVLNGTKDALDSHSPSRAMMVVGSDAILGMMQGLTNTMPQLLTAIQLDCFVILTRFKTELSITKFMEVGKNICLGIAAGIEQNADKVFEAAIKVADGSFSAMISALGISSPAKRMIPVGRFFDLGFAKGILDNSGEVETAALKTANSAVDIMRQSISDIYTGLFNEIDVNPVIRPTLDLSNIHAGAARMNSMLNSRQVAISNLGQTLGNAQVGTNGNSYQFVQNNYSPKALSRVEIYRQTRNQFSQLKGALSTT